MTQPIEIKVPDIGDFHDVSVIEVLVKPGDLVEKETPLITLETDKATMEVPSPMAGVVKEVDVKVNDKVSEGSLILKLEQPAPSAQAPETAGEPAQPPGTEPTPAPGAQKGVEPEITSAALAPEAAPPQIGRA